MKDGYKLPQFKFSNQKTAKILFFFNRCGVVTLCISITNYHGYGCSEKFVSNPATVNDETVPLNELPPLQWSICKQFVVTACTDTPLFEGGREGEFSDGGEYVYGSLFAQFDETEIEYVCNLRDQQIPNHSNTSSFYWRKLTERGQNYEINKLIAEIDIWNQSSFTWEPIHVSKDTKFQNLFR